MTPAIAPWPIAVYYDRYSGVYSGGTWIAASGETSLYDSDAFGGDVPCEAWWYQHGARVGRGATPDDALADLTRRWIEAGEPSQFDWDGE